MYFKPVGGNIATNKQNINHGRFIAKNKLQLKIIMKTHVTSYFEYKAQEYVN